MKYTFSIWLILFLCFNANSQGVSENKFNAEQFSIDNKSLNYQILYPSNFDKDKEYPLFIFLHGMGERGNDNQLQLTHGSKLFLDSIDNYPAVVIFPQCPLTDNWANVSRPNEGKGNRKFVFSNDSPPTPSLDLVMKLINDFKQKKFINSDKIYLSGLSMGGFGVFELLWRMPDTFAAAAPICGGGNREMAKYMVNTPVWIIHGNNDKIVPPKYSMKMMLGIQGARGKAKLSLYPNVGHNSWERAFEEPNFLNWFFSKSKK